MAVNFGPVQKACRDTFGETVSFTPAGGSAVSITAIFNLRSEVVEDGLAVIVHRPSIGIKTADLAASPRVGDAVTVRSVSYKIANVEDDGEGMHICLLHRTS